MSETRLKIMIIGSPGSGKTSFIKSINNSFILRDQNNYFISYSSKLKLNNHKFTIIIEEYNLEGAINYREKYLFTSKNQLQTADCIIFLFDLSDISFFKDFSQLLYNLKKSDELYSKLKIPFLIIGNKMDLKQRALSPEDISTLKKEIKDGIYIDCYSKSHQNNQWIFDLIINKMGII